MSGFAGFRPADDDVPNNRQTSAVQPMSDVTTCVVCDISSEQCSTSTMAHKVAHQQSERCCFGVTSCEEMFGFA